jgi:hypothetical protein
MKLQRSDVSSLTDFARCCIRKTLSADGVSDVEAAEHGQPMRRPILPICDSKPLTLP